jgi:hypothetical protein
VPSSSDAVLPWSGCLAPPRLPQTWPRALRATASPRPRPYVGVPEPPCQRPTSIASSRRRPPLRLASRPPRPPRSPPRMNCTGERREGEEEREKKEASGREKKEGRGGKKRKKKKEEKERETKKYLFIENMISKLYCLLLSGK